MNKKVFFVLVCLLSVMSLAACGPSQAELDAQATKVAADVFATQTAEVPTPTKTPTNTPTLEPTNTPTFTPTPTPTPLSAADIFASISPSVAFIETSIGRGSGVLVANGYVVTNAHVVWPFQEARIVFPDGSEYLNVPVVNWDLLGDLAVIGPLETSIDPIEFVDGEDLTVGSDVFLIGYPGEADQFPQPTFTRGLISRLREWTPLEMTYFQTDALIAGGQSGGVLVSEEGEVIGISGLSFTEAGFGLVASAIDVLPRIQSLIADEDVDSLGDRRLPVAEGQLEYSFTLRDHWDSRTYMINEPIGTDIDIKLEGDNEAGFALIDLFGNILTATVSTDSQAGTAVATTQMEIPYFVIVGQSADEPGDFHLNSNQKLVPYDDADDGTSVTVGQSLFANLDYVHDTDYFMIDMEEDDIININVESMGMDPFLSIDFPDATEEQVVFDDDSGGGLFGKNAELTYRAPHSGSYFLVVESATGSDVGSYFLTVGSAPPGATPVAPPPTSTPTPTPAPTSTPTPIPTPAIPMALHESDPHPFTMQYPEPWADETYTGEVAELIILEEDLIEAGVGEMTLEEYVDAILVVMSQEYGEDFELLSRQRTVNEQGLPVQIVISEINLGPDGIFKSIRLMYLHEGKISFNATYFAPEATYQELEAIINFSLSTFRVTE